MALKKQRIFAHPHRPNNQGLVGTPGASGTPGTPVAPQSGDPTSHAAHLSAQQQITAAAAQRWNVPAQILWGMFGAETNFGKNLSTSSAGAQGWMQFEPQTAAKYHVDVNNFQSSMFGAAHYLHDLMKQKGSLDAAISAYNTGPAAKFTNDAYVAQVKIDARQWPGGGGNIISPGVVQSQFGGPLGGVLNAVSSWTDLLTTLLSALVDPAQWAEYLANLFAWWLRVVWKALWKYVISPPIHWSQRATVFYWEQIMSGKDDPRAPVITLTFWAVGYGIFYAKAQDGRALAAPAKSTPFARTLRAAQGTAARRSLTKPQDVHKKTLPKPKPHESVAPIEITRSLSVTRRRSVTVQGEHARRAKRHSEPLTSEPTSEPHANVKQTHDLTPHHEESGARVDTRSSSGSGVESPTVQGTGSHGKPS